MERHVEEVKSEEEGVGKDEKLPKKKEKRLTELNNGN